jgi:hypothetical protein
VPRTSKDGVALDNAGKFPDLCAAMKPAAIIGGGITGFTPLTAMN